MWWCSCALKTSLKCLLRWLKARSTGDSYSSLGSGSMGSCSSYDSYLCYCKCPWCPDYCRHRDSPYLFSSSSSAPIPASFALSPIAMTGHLAFAGAPSCGSHRLGSTRNWASLCPLPSWVRGVGCKPQGPDHSSISRGTWYIDSYSVYPSYEEKTAIQFNGTWTLMLNL